MDYQLIGAESSLPVIVQVLINRGILPSNIDHYLNTTDDDILDPILLDNIDEGIKMLITHISQNDKVLVQVDSDCDGCASAAILLNYLHCHFPGFVENNIQYRIHTGKQHGIVLDSIPEDVRLVIVPDAGSNDRTECAALKERGTDVLILDHHESDDPPKDACIINNQLCDYPTKSLSGAGIVYKFCQRIDQIMECQFADQFLDLVALALVADMMDLRDFETRHLVTRGLANVRNPYFKAMVEKNSFSLGGVDNLTPIGVAFYIAPYVNATIRVGTQDEKLILFESMLDYRGYELIPSTKRGCKGQVETRVEQACRNCTNIKNRQTKARDASLSIVEQLIEENNLLENKILVIKLDIERAIEKNLTGLIANQLMAKYQRPVLLLNQIIHKDPEGIWITWEGSGRGYEKSKLNDFRSFLRDTGYPIYVDGHANAFGFGIKETQFEEFVDFSNKTLANFDFSPNYKVDFIFDSDNFKGSDILQIAGYKQFWGQNVDEPLIALENIKVSSNVFLMSADKNPTLKIVLPNGTSLIKFKSSKEEFEKLKSELGCVTINVVGRCEQNFWNGTVSPQIIIEDYEIVNETKYYF